MALYRGEYRLAHMSQVLGRDEMVGEIARHAGGSCVGYMLDDEQVLERARGDGSSYRFLLYSPKSAAISWTAFYARSDLDAFVRAYGYRLDCEPEPGHPFRVFFPANAADFLPLVDETRVREVTYNYPNRAFLEVDAATPEDAERRVREWRESGSPWATLTPEKPVDLGAGLWRVRLS